MLNMVIASKIDATEIILMGEINKIRGETYWASSNNRIVIKDLREVYT